MLLVGNMLPLEEAQASLSLTQCYQLIWGRTQSDCLCFKISKVDVKHITSSLSVSGLHSDSTSSIASSMISS